MSDDQDGGPEAPGRRQSSVKNPPPFSGQHYAKWRKEVHLWTRLTDLKEELKALAIVMALEGRPRDIGLQIDPEKLETRTGVKLLLDKLDECYKQEDADEAFNAWLKFSTMRRQEGMSMEQFLVEHDHAASEAESHKLTVPDAVEAYILLSNAGLTPSERALVLASTGIPVTKAKMASSLRRMYGARRDEEEALVVDAKEEPSASSSNGESKLEEILLALKDLSTGERNFGRRLGGREPRGRRKRRNPVRNGKVLTCTL